MFTPGFQAVYLVVTLVAFSAVALATGATVRVVFGAATSVVVFTAISAPIDTLALKAGWWSYPSCQTPPHPPLPVYVGQAALFVGCAALLGVPLQRRFGKRGALGLAAVACSLGVVRDFSVAAFFPGVIRFGPAPTAVLADIGAWLIVVLVALSVTRLIAGPASAQVP